MAMSHIEKWVQVTNIEQIKPLTDKQTEKQAHLAALSRAIDIYQKCPTYWFDLITKNMAQDHNDLLEECMGKLYDLGWEVRYVGKSKSGQGCEAGKRIRKAFEE